MPELIVAAALLYPRFVTAGDEGALGEDADEFEGGPHP